MEKTPAPRRHDISDYGWEIIEPLLPGRPGSWGGKARDNRLFINIVLWILRTGAKEGNEVIGLAKEGKTRKYILPSMRRLCR